jgi:hypothetical protein
MALEPKSLWQQTLHAPQTPLDVVDSLARCALEVVMVYFAAALVAG